MIPTIPGGYGVIYADPCWQFKDQNRNGNRGAGCKYQTMTLPQLMALPVRQIAAPDSVLLMWHVPAMPAEALQLATAWGFTVRTMKAFTWVKMNKRFADNLRKSCRKSGADIHGMDEASLLQLMFAATKMGLGHHTRGNTEDVLIAVRGRGLERQSKSVRQLIFSPVREHSRKPDEARHRIEQLYGDVPRIELFARQSAPGWDSWGNESTKFDQEAA